MSRNHAKLLAQVHIPGGGTAGEQAGSSIIDHHQATTGLAV